MKHYTLCALLALALWVGIGSTESAYARVGIGGGVIIGEPYYAYPPYYGYPYYAYAPPPVYYPPPQPVYSYVPPPPLPNDRYYTAPDNRYCREFHHRVVIEGQTREAYGHACREPDGSWRIID